jgi:ABC-2 type transport system ATP-binding protein
VIEQAAGRLPNEDLAVPEPAVDPLPVRLAGVTKRYGRRVVLDGVSFEVPRGITGLVGPNGAGKSTLVRAMLGLVRLASGGVRVFGLDPAVAARRVRRLVGVVPEDDATVPGLSGVEMVHYAARLAGLPTSEALRRSHEVLDWCDAGQERYRGIETLGLDPLERRAMLGRLVSLARDHGKAILVSTHVLRDVQSICDSLVLLVRGRVRLAGSLATLTQLADRELVLRGEGPLAAAAGALASRGIPARMTDSGDGLVVQAVDDTSLVAVWEAARAAGVTAWSLEPRRLALEDVFLAALAAADEADARGIQHAPA